MSGVILIFIREKVLTTLLNYVVIFAVSNFMEDLFIGGDGDCLTCSNLGHNLSYKNLKNEKGGCT